MACVPSFCSSIFWITGQYLQAIYLFFIIRSRFRHAGAVRYVNLERLHNKITCILNGRRVQKITKVLNLLSSLMRM
jgi:hypothetical protein